MATLKRLRQQAREASRYRGHNLAPFVATIPGRQAFTECQDCPAYVVVDTDPAPNGIDIGGSAVAVGCGDLASHHCRFGPFESAHFTGEAIRRCLVPGCKTVSMDGEGED